LSNRKRNEETGKMWSLSRQAMLRGRTGGRFAFRPTPGTSSIPTASRLFAGGSSHDGDKVYLHVGPAGDCWTGNNIFAAKHLSPDYVKSILLPDGLSTEILLEEMEENPDLGQQAYDTELLPEVLVKRVREAQSVLAE
jgi:hypothetical protein